MRPRHKLRQKTRVETNATRCGLTVPEYLALPRRERKRRLQAAPAGGDGRD
jgi:hypothetical protein